jgi:hypothetical protein
MLRESDREETVIVDPGAPIESGAVELGVARPPEAGGSEVVTGMNRGIDESVADGRFERPLEAVCGEMVGAVLALGASRLARNSRDWHHLIDPCTPTDALVVDHDGVYDSRYISWEQYLQNQELLCFRLRSEVEQYVAGPGDPGDVCSRARVGSYAAGWPAGGSSPRPEGRLCPFSAIVFPGIQLAEPRSREIGAWAGGIDGAFGMIAAVAAAGVSLWASIEANSQFAASFYVGPAAAARRLRAQG